MSEKPYTNIEVTRGEKSDATITGEIPYETLSHYRTAALADATARVEVDGFRKGNAPENVVIENIGGEEALLSQAAERALNELWPQIIREQELDAIGQPQVSITKLAPENPLGFSITVALMPTVTLPDYKHIAKDVMQEETNTDVTDEEVADVVTRIQKQRAQQQESVQPADAESSGETQSADAESSGETKQENTFYDADGNPIQSTSGESTEATETASEDSEELPELTDEFVKTLGDFKDVADFKAKIKENLAQEKEMKNREKQRLAAAEQIIEQSTIPLPDILLHAELDKMFGQFEQDVARAGASMDEYLKHVGKDKETLREEWKPEAEKRAKLQLALNKIATEEDLAPSNEEIENESKRLLEQYPDADENAVRAYVATALTNEKVFQMLESQAPGNAKQE